MRTPAPAPARSGSTACIARDTPFWCLGSSGLSLPSVVLRRCSRFWGRCLRNAKVQQSQAVNSSRHGPSRAELAGPTCACCEIAPRNSKPLETSAKLNNPRSPELHPCSLLSSAGLDQPTLTVTKWQRTNMASAFFR